MGVKCSTQVGEMRAEFQSENLKELNHLGNQGVYGRKILKFVLQK
jgi:hypothetical protein